MEMTIYVHDGQEMTELIKYLTENNIEFIIDKDEDYEGNGRFMEEWFIVVKEMDLITVSAKMMNYLRDHKKHLMVR